MTSYITDIFVFGEGSSKRSLRLTKGLNIVTGLSKKGKSALIEIVDYCLCANVPAIPKGVISSYAKLFSIVLKVEAGFLVIARPSDEKENSKIYVSLEKNRKFIRGFDRSYFANHELKRIKGAGQEDIEKFLGLNLADYRTNDSEKNRGKASMRNMTPFLYQYQNLIASKHALFSKLDDYQKRKSIVEQIPIFLGIVDADYFSLCRQIDEIERRLRAIDREKLKEQSFNKQYESRLQGLLQSYYAIVGRNFPDKTNLNSLLKEDANKSPM